MILKFAKTTAEYTDDMEKKKILLYVRKKNEEIFDGIFLCEPTLKGLKKAVRISLLSCQITIKVLENLRKGLKVFKLVNNRTNC